jgi:hypothetical protein
MPIPLPDDRDIVRRVYEDALVIATALQRHIDTSRQPDFDRKMKELVGKQSFGPHEAWLRLQPFLDHPIDYQDGRDACLAWFKGLLSRLTVVPGQGVTLDSWTGLLVGEQQRFLILRDAALTKLNELTADPTARPDPPPAQTDQADNRPQWTADLLTGTLQRLKGCGKQADILQYLWDREADGRGARISQVAKDLYRRGAIEKTARRQLERTRDKLEGERCPLRLFISGNSVRLTRAYTPE